MKKKQKIVFFAALVLLVTAFTVISFIWTSVYLTVYEFNHFS